MAHLQLLVLIVALIKFCYTGSATLLKQQSQQVAIHDSSGSPNYNITFREAEETDLDDITTLYLDAFSPSPAFRYAFPRYLEFKEYVWRCTRKDLHVRADPMPDNIFINVIAVENDTSERVVSIAAWFLKDPADADQNEIGTELLSILSRPLEVLFPSATARQKCSDHLDTNMTRAKDFDRQFSAAEKHFIKHYPGKQMYLGLLATHPDWDGHGFGARQLQWGTDKMNGTGIPITLIATPAGWPLYDSTGFDSLANITIWTFDWPDDLWFEYMRYDTA